MFLNVDGTQPMRRRLQENGGGNKDARVRFKNICTHHRRFPLNEIICRPVIHIPRITFDEAWNCNRIGSCACLAFRAGHGRFSLAGKVVLISGGSRGLGLILARQGSSEGGKVVLLARRRP